jgi:hypothetical protein
MLTTMFFDNILLVVNFLYKNNGSLFNITPSFNLNSYRFFTVSAPPQKVY